MDSIQPNESMNNPEEQDPILKSTSLAAQTDSESEPEKNANPSKKRVEHTDIEAKKDELRANNAKPKSPDSQFPNHSLTPRSSFVNVPDSAANRLTPAPASDKAPSTARRLTGASEPTPSSLTIPVTPSISTPTPQSAPQRSLNYPTPLPPPSEGEIGLPCPTCGLAFNQAIVICPNDGTSLRRHISAKISLVKRFEFLSEAGVGGVGTIYKAKQRNNDNIVAIKMLSFDDVSSEAKKRFQEEAKACSRMEHINLPKLLDYGLTEHGQPYMVLEYFDGSDLSDVLKKAGGVSLFTALDIAEQICSGLQYAHAQGVLHRDLKPSNIMIKWNDGNPLVKIVDFGIAKLIDDEEHRDKLTKTGEVIGTPTYMSPEQILGKEVDQRSDLYSVGCVLYELLAGVPPFTGENSVQTILKQLNDKPLTMSEASKGRTFPLELENTIARLLQKEPKDRYRNAGALKEDIHEVRAKLNQVQSAISNDKPKAPAQNKVQTLIHKIEHQVDKLPDQREMLLLLLVFMAVLAIILFGVSLQNSTLKSSQNKDSFDSLNSHKNDAKSSRHLRHEHSSH